MEEELPPPPPSELNHSVKRDHIEITIEDVAIDTIIDLRKYMRENGISTTSKPLSSVDLTRWLQKFYKP
jgi:hypothetical protein